MPPEDDWLDRALREEDSYIPDEGFTRRMLASLPPPRRGREWLRPAVLVCTTSVASLTAALFMPRFEVLAATATKAAALLAPGLVQIAPIVLVSLSVSGLTIASCAVFALAVNEY